MIKNNNNKYKILTPKGFQDFSGIRKLPPTEIIELLFEDNSNLKCTPDHILFSAGMEIFAKDLQIDSQIDASEGYKKIIGIKHHKELQPVYDALNVQPEEKYITNGVVSHNCFIEKGKSAVSGGVISGIRESCLPPKYLLKDDHYKVWEDPIPGNIYVAGIDVAEGVGEAASVIQILDITNLQDIRQVACYHNETIDPYHFAHEIYKIAHQWGKPPLLIERNNCGGQIIDVLQNTYQYEKIVKYIPGKLAGANRVGILCHVNSKYKGITNMRYWLNSLQCVEIRDLALLHEFETFVKHDNNTWKKQPGKNTRDDRVMAMCWALFILQEEITPQYFDVVEWDDKGKPQRIEHVYVPEPEYYKLDDYFMNDNSPLPMHFDGEQDPEEEKIKNANWLFAL